MILSTELAGLLGPYTDIDVRTDRLVCDGAEVPFAVIGAYQQLDVEVPPGARAEDYNLVDGELQPKAASITQEP